MSDIVPKLHILYTNIGRGHPFYLDGIIDALIRRGSIGIIRRESDVFELSSFLPRCLWCSARWLYEHGSSGGISGVAYRMIRSRADYGNSSPLVRLMGRDIRRQLSEVSGPVLVAHPTLVGILRGKTDLLYQHGELVAPREALVSGADSVFVPTREVADEFVRSGYPSDRIEVTGLCIEPALARQAQYGFENRIDRIRGDGPLTGAFFSSGAEPRPHVEKLAVGALSVVRRKGRVLIFGRRGGRVAEECRRVFRRSGVDLNELGPADPIPSDPAPAQLVLSTSRREESIFTAQLFPFFDYFLAPSHERVNWAAGLGLPMFILDPCIGPFAPLNRDLALSRGVARALSSTDDARALGRCLESLRGSGDLEKMSHAGWGKVTIDGFDTIAALLIKRYS